MGSSITDMELDNPQAVFTDKFILKKMEAFIKDPECRFDKIEVPLKGKKKAYLAFKGRRYNKNSTDELATIATRPMTWTDLFYMASEDAVEDKHILITRYPLLDQYGLFATRIRTLSTTTTMPMQVGDKIYRWYPVIDFDVPRNQINTKFMDSVQFSNSYLPGIDRKPSSLSILNLSNCGKSHSTRLLPNQNGDTLVAKRNCLGMVNNAA